MFNDILLALSPSEICRYAADAAVVFSKRHEAKLHIVHVAEPADGSWSDLQTVNDAECLKKACTAIEERFQDKIAKLKGCVVEVVPGFAENEILRLARAKEADLVIMGPHERPSTVGSLTRWGRTGSVLEAVGQRARCPVMIVSRPIAPDKLEFKNILAATDLTEHSDCALGYAAQLARFYKAEVLVQHVVDVGSQFERLKVSQEEIESLIEEGKTMLRKKVEPIMAGVKFSVEVWEGVPSVEILKLARWRESDLVIMAHHSRKKDMEAPYFGSTVAQVALRSQCPTIGINRLFDFRCSSMFE